jgi:hypothetical protein
MCIYVGINTGAQAAGEAFATNVFNEQGFGYTIQYPDGWVYEVPDGATVVFSGPRGTKAYFSTVSIQNLFSTKKEKGKYRDIGVVVDNLIGQLKTAKNVTISIVKPFSYSKGTMKLDGRQFTAEYTLGNDRFKQLSIVIPRPKEDIFHTWFYTSALSQYNEFESIALAMLDSWTIIESKNGGQSAN